MPEATDATGEDTEAVHADVVDGGQDAPHLVWHSSWVRARADGLVHLDVSLGSGWPRATGSAPCTTRSAGAWRT